MSTGNTPAKTALNAARIALLAGVSAAALSLSMSAAQAQQTFIDSAFASGNPGEVATRDPTSTYVSPRYSANVQ